MSIYTRTGDSGQTSLADGTRVDKASARVEAFGAVDEANSAVGHSRAAIADDRLDEVLSFAQQRLFNCSASLAYPRAVRRADAASVGADDVAFLEEAIDEFEAATGPIRGFVLEGGTEASARLHVARAICRRAERRIVALAANEDVDAQVLAFVNRLSDTLFAAARYANSLKGHADEAWDPTVTPPRR